MGHKDVPALDYMRYDIDAHNIDSLAFLEQFVLEGVVEKGRMYINFLVSHESECIIIIIIIVAALISYFCSHQTSDPRLERLQSPFSMYLHPCFWKSQIRIRLAAASYRDASARVPF